MKRTFFAALFLLVLSAVYAESNRIGVLVLAHGGSPQWNARVEQAVKEAQLPYPTEISFGMGMMQPEVRNLQQAVDRLQSQGVKRILAVPLLVSSYSSVYRQYQYLLGQRQESSWAEHPVQPIRKEAGIQILKALDDSDLVAQILLERALKLSRDPSREAVVLVAHGPEENEENRLWLAAMESLGRKVREGGRFAALSVATLQDDAPQAIREEATKRLREQVSVLAERYKVLVVPLLLSQNGIEEKVRERLTGLSYVYTGVALLPHPNITRWIRRQVERAIS